MRSLKKLDLTQIVLPVSAMFVLLIFLLRAHTILVYEITIIASLFYLAVAFIHHHYDKSLTFEIIVEYVLIAALTLIILQGILI